VLKLLGDSWAVGLDREFSVFDVSLQVGDDRAAAGRRPERGGYLEYSLTQKNALQRFWVWLRGRKLRTDATVRIYFKIDPAGMLSQLDGAEILIAGSETRRPDRISVLPHQLNAVVQIMPQTRERPRRPTGMSLGTQPATRLIEEERMPVPEKAVEKPPLISGASIAAIGFWLWGFINQISLLYPFRILHEHLHALWGGYGKILVNPDLLAGKIFAWISPFADVAQPQEWDEGANVIARFATHGGNALSNWVAGHSFFTQMGPLVPNIVDLWIGMGLLSISQKIRRPWLKNIVKGLGLAQFLIVGTYIMFDFAGAHFGNFSSLGDFGESARSFLNL